MKKEPHIDNGKKTKSADRIRLEEIVNQKYQAIWSHESMYKVINLYSRITGLTAALSEKGIKYDKDLKTAVKFSPLENPDLALGCSDFAKMLGEASLQRIRRINEDFDITLMWLNDGYCLRNLHGFIADYNYKLANFGKPKVTFGYDPNYAVSSSTRPHVSHSTRDDD